VTAGRIRRGAQRLRQGEDGVLALANRYDGIDPADETCRLVVLAGLPVGMHLEERFIHHSLGAPVVLTERIRTRLTQGAGRATRYSTDFAAVIMLGRDLLSFCAQPDVLAASHPEFRAEIGFGLKTPAACRPPKLWRTSATSSTRTTSGATPSR
jgi:hypothetical protein